MDISPTRTVILYTGHRTDKSTDQVLVPGSPFTHSGTILNVLSQVRELPIRRSGALAETIMLSSLAATGRAKAYSPPSGAGACSSRSYRPMRAIVVTQLHDLVHLLHASLR
jgi:hypothetical protein